MDTPKELEKLGYIGLNTDEDSMMTGIIIPQNTSNTPMRGTLQMVIEDAGEDLDVCRDLVYTSPELTPASPYRVKPTVYISNEDRLVTFDRCIGMDGILAIIGLLDDEDIRLEWEKSKTFEVETS